MLNYINLELSAIVVLLILIMFYRSKNSFKLLQNMYFSFFMLITLIASILSYSLSLIDHYNVSSDLLLYTAGILTHSFSVLSIYAFFIFTLSAVDRLKKLAIFKYKLFFIPMFVAIISILCSPKTKAIFYINEYNDMVLGDGYIVLFIVSMFYAISSLYIVLLNRKTTNNKKRFMIYLFSIVSIAVMCVEYFVIKDTSIIFYCTSMLVLIMYISIQNPDYYVDITNGLLNREAFKLMVSEDIDYNIPFNCISLQLDEYNTLNEVYGIKKCDLLIKEIGSFLKSSFPRANVFIITNSQFIIIDKDKTDFPVFDQVISDRFNQKWIIEGYEVKVTKSSCCLSYPDFYGNIDQLLSIVKFALEESFNTNTMVIVGEYIISKMNHNIAVEKAVEKAIEANAIQVYYQPIYSAKDKKITSAEALSRLFDDELGFIPPDEFIKVAEENGSILRLGQQIFEKVCVFIKNNDLSKYGIHYIEVNLSPIQCMQRELATELIDIATSYGLPMSNFNLEITESATTDSKDHIKINMEKLCDKKTTFSLDDYGTGFSNITAIMDLPFQYVKIDKSIVWAYFDNTNSILEHLVNMFKKENLLIITEGVETQEQSNKLIEMGCDYLQGFYFSKAIPGEDFISYISA